MHALGASGETGECEQEKSFNRGGGPRRDQLDRWEKGRLVKRFKASAPVHLITGGAGFIGSHLADALVARGDRVVILDDLSTGRRENIVHLIENGDAIFVEGSVLDADLVDQWVERTDSVFHLAS